MSTNMTPTELLEAFELLLATATRPEVAAKLLLFAYDEVARQVDEALLAEARAAYITQQKEQTEAKAATLTEDELQATARSAFIQLHRLIQLADRTQPKLNVKHLMSTKRLPNGEAAFLKYTTALLGRLESQAQIVTALAKFGFTPERIAELKALLEAVRQADVTQQKEIAEAKQATLIYQDRIAQVRIAHRVLKTLAEESLADNAELLKLLG